MARIKTYSEWKEFSKGYATVSVFYTAEDVFAKTALYANHREFIKALFKDKGVEVTRFGHTYSKEDPREYWGLMFHRTDSDIVERYEVTALIDVNARRIMGFI